jgi:hypothetical protein
MCTGLEVAALTAAAAGTAVGAVNANQQRKDAAGQKGALLRAEADRKAAEARAAQTAQAQAGDTRRRQRAQSLLSSGATGPVSSTGSALAYGKQALGQ